MLVIATIVGAVVWLQRRKQRRRDEASQGEKFAPGGAYEVGPMQRVAAVDDGDYELSAPSGGAYEVGPMQRVNVEVDPVQQVRVGASSPKLGNYEALDLPAESRQPESNNVKV